MVTEKVLLIKVFVLGLQDTESCAVHFRVESHVGSVEQTILILLKELRHISGNWRRLAEPGADVGEEVWRSVQHLAEDREIRTAIGEMARDEGGARMFLYGSVKRGDDFIVP